MSDAILDKTALLAAVGLGQKLGTPQTDEEVHFAVIPNDSKIESLRQFQYPHGLPPERIVATVELRDSGSFAAYVNDFKDPDRTRVFAEPGRFNFCAVLDYHPAAAGMKPSFCEHRAKFQLQMDDRWKIWTGQNEKPMTQTEFAEFLEDNKADISEPTPARMLEIASDLQANTEVNFGASTKLSNGQTRLRYEETVKMGVGAAGDIEIPDEFSIRIPVFYGEAAVVIKARLRPRVTAGKLTFHYKLYRPVEIQNTAFDCAVKAIGEDIQTTVLLGSPA